MRTVRRAKRVVDVDVAQLGQGRAERRNVRLLGLDLWSARRGGRLVSS